MHFDTGVIAHLMIYVWFCVPLTFAELDSTTTFTTTITILLPPSCPTSTMVFESLKQLEDCNRELQDQMSPKCFICGM
jgi:hypothetical protein